MTPADVVAQQLLEAPTVTEVTRAIWLGGLAEVKELPALSVQVSERAAYETIDVAMRDTRADVIVSALATTYQAAYDLAVIVGNALHGLVLDETGISVGPLTWARLDPAAVSSIGQATVFEISQVFACNIRRQ